MVLGKSRNRLFIHFNGSKMLPFFLEVIIHSVEAFRDKAIYNG